MARILLTAIALWLFAHAAGAEPDVQAPQLYDLGAELEVFRFLSGASDREAMTALLGVAPLSCMETGSGSDRLCEWRVEGDNSGWRALAEAFHSRDRISILCVLPMNGDPRGPDSCSAHLRRSNRDRWKVQRRPGDQKRRFVPIAKTEAYRRELANQMLDDAGTLISLSRLMGEMPSDCAPGGVDRVCVWHATNRTWGHGTLALIIDSDRTKKLRLECRLPFDGTRRQADSCRIEVGP